MKKTILALALATEVFVLLVAQAEAHVDVKRYRLG
jgi:hypothetical protein